MRIKHAPWLLLPLSAGAAAFPDGAPWEAAGQEGCVQCHFDASAADESDAISVEGLPPAVEPGQRYALTLRLEDDHLVTAGFLVSVWQGGDEAGTFISVGPRTEANGAMARSTEAGSTPETPGAATWQVEWAAPEPAETPGEAPIVIEVWANAANDDQSPFGDATHRRTWRLQRAPRAPATRAASNGDEE